MTPLAPLPFRAVARHEPGTEFVDYLYELADSATSSPTQARALAQRAWVFSQQYDNLRDERLQAGEYPPAAPSVEDYAKRWRLPYRSAARTFVEVSTLLGGVEPWQVCIELWEGVGRQAPPTSLMAVGTVKVAPVQRDEGR